MVDAMCRCLSGAVLISTTIVVAVMTNAAAAKPATVQKKGPAPFCISRGGGDGASGSYTECMYYDYQACLEAAAVRGNCVRNIEFK
jgi:hypothetical protein